MLLDNHSLDDSVENIKRWATDARCQAINSSLKEFTYPPVSKPIRLVVIPIEFYRQQKRGKPTNQEINVGTIMLVNNSQNSGFAAGNNIGIRIAQKLWQSNYFFLLNNDTVIEPQTVSSLVDFLENQPDYRVATSTINYYEQPQKIANAGGKLNWWGTQNYYADLKNKPFQQVTFVTGCALMVNNNIFQDYGLLSEQFFFGEEDFEFSWRMRKHREKMACVANSIVYHKISASSVKLYANLNRKKFVHVFNRVINMKLQLKRPLWIVWRYIMLSYTLFWFTIKHKNNFSTTLKFIRHLHFYSNQFNDARKVTVEKIYREIGL